MPDTLAIEKAQIKIASAAPENKGFVFRYCLAGEQFMVAHVQEGWEIWKPSDPEKARKAGLYLAADGSVRNNELVLCRRPAAMRDEHFRMIAAKRQLKDKMLKQEQQAMNMTEVIHNKP